MVFQQLLETARFDITFTQRAHEPVATFRFEFLSLLHRAKHCVAKRLSGLVSLLAGTIRLDTRLAVVECVLSRFAGFIDAFLDLVPDIHAVARRVA